MNDAVQVTGMQVQAKSNTTYLLISNANTDDVAPANAAAIQAENDGAGFTSVALTGSSALYPVAPASALTVGSSGSHTNYAAGADAGQPTYWYTMIGTDPTSTGYVGKEHTEQDVTGSSASYVLKKTFYFTIAAGANGATDLVVDSVTITNTAAAVRCLVVGPNGNSELYTESSDTDSIVLVPTLNNTTVYAVTVYVYYDGNYSSIYTNNIPSIDAGTVALTFKVTAGAGE